MLTQQYLTRLFLGGLSLLLVVASCFTASLAFADSQDTLNFTAGVSKRYDDNLFRNATNVQSDSQWQLSAGVKFDKKFSLQRITANATITKNAFNKKCKLRLCG